MPKRFSPIDELKILRLKFLTKLDQTTGQDKRILKEYIQALDKILNNHALKFKYDKAKHFD